MTKALSLTVFAERSNVTDGLTDGRTDGQNWYSNSRPDAARYALASVAKISHRERFRFQVKMHVWRLGFARTAERA